MTTMHVAARKSCSVFLGWLAIFALASTPRVVFAAQPPPVRLVHRFVEAVISPDGAVVASIEGEGPRSGSLPQIRDLVIRGVQTGAAIKVDLPCGHVPECWPE